MCAIPSPSALGAAPPTHAARTKSRVKESIEGVFFGACHHPLSNRAN